MSNARALRVATWVSVAFGIFVTVAAGCGTSSTSNDGAGTAKKDAAATAPASDTGATTSADDAGTSDGGQGGEDAAATEDSQAPLVPGADAAVTAFNQTLICFGAVDGGKPCSRTVDEQATFPTTGTFSKILMHVTLDCPTTLGGCDHWDRVGSLDLVTQGATTEAGTVETLTELGRFVTPYDILSGVNSPPVWDIDVTELRPLLSGTVTLRAFIDTWVPQGDPKDNGAGWLLSATFEMTGGTPAKIPVAVVPIWTWTTTGREPTSIAYGDPTRPISSSLPPQSLLLPAGATSFGVRTTITGHGQGNLDDCSEFCSKKHTWTVGTVANTQSIWRTDCTNYPSSGTYKNPRAGWCPGAAVVPWDFDVTAEVDGGAAATFAYDVEAYVNTCNGDPDGGCVGCTANSCTIDGADHTSPIYYVSSLLIGFQ
jgi:Peptide-N-glycosidase F, C terminal/Peptide-N-glycosidase F, N terminal